MQAGIAQLVEHKLPKLGVAGSSPVARTRFAKELRPDSLFEVFSPFSGKTDALRIAGGMSVFTVGL